MFMIILAVLIVLGYMWYTKRQQQSQKGLGRGPMGGGMQASDYL